MKYKSEKLTVTWFVLFVLFLISASFLTGYYLSPQVNLTLTFTQAWTDLAQTTFQGLGLLSLFFFWLERTNGDKWNRLRETLNLTWTTPYPKLCQKIRDLEHKQLFDRTWNPMTAAELNTVLKNADAKQCIRDFLDHLEEIATGYKLGVFDREYFRSIWFSILKKNFGYFEPFIINQRLELGQEDLYEDLEIVIKNLK
jgi:hypothetical protein